jgi:translocation and assembly module TamB
MTVSGLSNVPLTANARIARSPNGLGFDANAGLSGRLAWRGAVGEITKFAPLVGQQISGNLNADLTLSGTLGRPGVAGSAVMSDGSVEDYVTGLALRFPRLAIVGDNRRLELQPFEAIDQSGGKLSGRGSVDLDADASFPFRAELTFANARVANRDDIMATLSGAITAEGNLAKATIRGDLRSERVEVDLDTGLPPSVVTLDVVEIPADGQPGVAKQKASEREAEEGAAGSEFLLDIKLHMPGQVFVRGHGLDSEWEGDIAVAGSAAKPRVTGQLRSRRGQIDFLDKLFKLQPSVINLAPTAAGGVDALLNIKAIATAKDLTVTVTVSGPATNPTIELSSTPVLPQDEILSRLLFNKNRASLSPVEALQLANALSTLRGGGSNFMAKLRRTLGVDVLRVGSGSGGETAPSLEAGKYVTDRIYVGVKQGADPGSSAVSVEVDVFNNVSVGSEIRQDGGNRVGLKYKWDY